MIVFPASPCREGCDAPGRQTADHRCRFAHTLASCVAAQFLGIDSSAAGQTDLACSRFPTDKLGTRRVRPNEGFSGERGHRSAALVARRSKRPATRRELMRRLVAAEYECCQQCIAERRAVVSATARARLSIWARGARRTTAASKRDFDVLRGGNDVPIGVG